MPGYKAHILGGAVFVAAATAAVFFLGIYEPELETAACLTAIAILGALFPDTDTDSKGQNIFFGTIALIDLYLLYIKNYKWAAILGFCAILPAFVHHRGWKHTWWALIVVPLPILLLPHLFLERPIEQLLPYYAAGFVGYLSHLLLDRFI